MKESAIVFQGESIRAILQGQKTVSRRILNEAKLRVRLPLPVSSDFSDILPTTMALRAKPGTHRATMNQHGAVSMLMGKPSSYGLGEATLGVKPGEFDFVCPYTEGTTRLDKTIEPGRWTVFPYPGQQLWVREAWAYFGDDEYLYQRDKGGVDYRANFLEGEERRHGECRFDLSNPPGGRWRSPIHMPRWAARLFLEVTTVRLERLHDIDDADIGAEGYTPELVERLTGSRTTSPRAGWIALWGHMHGKDAWAKNPWVWRIAFRRLPSPRFSPRCCAG